jgi:hypothetical protein
MKKYRSVNAALAAIFAAADREDWILEDLIFQEVSMASYRTVVYFGCRAFFICAVPSSCGTVYTIQQEVK